MGQGGLDDVSVLSLAGLMRRAGCWCSPGAGAHFEASPGHPRDGGCLHPQTPEQETAMRLNPSSAKEGRILVLPQAFVWGPTLVVSHLEIASHQGVLPITFFCDHLKPRWLSLRSGDRGDWFIPL